MKDQQKTTNAMSQDDLIRKELLAAAWEAVSGESEREQRDALAILLRDPRFHLYAGRAFTRKLVALACVLDNANLSDAARSHNCTRHALSKMARRARAIWGLGGKSSPKLTPHTGHE